MPSEISTYLSGRYVCLPVYPLSFREFLDFRAATGTCGDLPGELQKYLRQGGFPLLAAYDFDEKTQAQLVEGAYLTLLRDIAKRHAGNDWELFERVARYIFENVGQPFSVDEALTCLQSEGRTLTVETLNDYVKYLEETFIVERCSSCDLRNQAVLQALPRFYLADPAFRLLVRSDPSPDAMFKNIVYLELRRRGYQVYIDQLGDKEIDFVAERRGERCYLQLCRDLPEQSERELTNLLAIADNYPKLVVTLDDFATGTVEGVRIVHLQDFLLDERSL